MTDPPHHAVAQQFDQVSRWIVVCGLPRTSASSAESMKGIRLRASNSCRSEIAKLGFSLLRCAVLGHPSVCNFKVLRYTSALWPISDRCTLARILIRSLRGPRPWHGEAQERYLGDALAGIRLGKADPSETPGATCGTGIRADYIISNMTS